MVKIVKSIFKRLIILIPIIILFLLFYTELLSLEKRNARNKIVNDHLSHLVLMDYVVDTLLKEYYATLNLVLYSNEMSSFLANPSSENRGEIEALFNRISNNRSYIRGSILCDASQIISTGGIEKYFPFSEQRIDLLGKEKLRESIVNWAKELPKDKVQYTLIDAQSYGGESTGVIHSLVMTVPIYKESEMVAILGMMVDTNHLISVLEEFLLDHPEGINFFLVDHKANILLRYENGELFSFEDSYGRLDQISNNLWNQLNKNREGMIKEKGQEYHYYTFSPLEEEGFLYSDNYFLAAFISFSEKDVPFLENSFILRSRSLPIIIIVAIVIIGTFITLLVLFRQGDQEQLAVSSLVSDKSHDGVVITDNKQNITYSNRTFSLMSSYSSEDVKNGQFKITSLDKKPVEVTNLALTKGKNRTWTNLVWINGKRHISLANLNLSSVVDGNNEILHTVFLFSNPINIVKELCDNLLEVDVNHEQAIDLYPLEKLQKLVNACYDLIVVLIKVINIDAIESKFSIDEQYLLASQIRKRFYRELDLGTDNILIQYSLEHFLVAKCIGSGDHRFVERLEALFAKPFKINNKTQQILIRAGISTLGNKNKESRALFRESRIALAALEHFERGGTLRYDKGVDEHLIRYYAILKEFPNAIRNGEIEIFYQPVVDVHTHQIISCEALARWNHPHLGFVSPGEFIPVVEQNNLERMLGRYVVEQVTKFLKVLPQELSVSINICPSELQDPDLVKHMVTFLDVHKVEHSRLIVELTERTLLTDLERANKVLAKLRKENILVAIDDFGTGFSSLSYLHGLDIDVLKIDRSFIADYPENDDGVIFKAQSE